MDIYGTVSGAQPIYVSGNIHDTGADAPQINIHSGAIIECKDGSGIYLAGYARTTINKDAELTSDGNIINIAAGELTVNGGTFIGGNGLGHDAGSGGSISIDKSAAVYVKQHGPNPPLKVTIKDGSFSAAWPLYQAYGQSGDTAKPELVSLAVNGGTFTSTYIGNEENVVAVYSADKTGFITGGTFSSNPTDYVAASHKVTGPVAGMYSVDPRGAEDENAAKIGNTYYATVVGAIDAAQPGNTVVLLKAYEGDAISVAKAIQIDATGYADSLAKFNTAEHFKVVNQTESTKTFGLETFTVTFISNGGSDVSTQVIEYNFTATEPNAPTKTGYSFEGWFTDSELTDSSSYNFSTAVTANIILYAKWAEKAVYTVAFNSNGGSEVTTQNVYSGDLVSAPTAPTKSGYTFGGWYSDIGLTSKYDFSAAVTADVTLYAKWEKKTTGGGGGGGGSSATPSNPTTSTETKPDGSTTTTESKPDGTVTESNTSKPVTDASGNTTQTTTETTTGKDGVTESKTETTTNKDGSGSATTETTVTKPDGTTTESKTETTINKDGSTASTTTATTTNKDGTVTESKTEATTSTVTNKDGSTTETKQETTTTSTGSKTESTTVTTVNKDGSSTATTTATTTDKAGTVTESKTESTTNKNGTTTEKTTTTETKANGTVTESTTATTINKDGSSKATTTETVTKADGTKVESKTTATTSLSTNKTTGTVTETKKETTTTSDGVKSEGTTVTQIQKDGTVTSKETVKASDSTGTTATKTTTLDAKGEVTTKAEATVSTKAVTEAAKTGGAVTLPVEVPTAKTTEAAPTVQVTMPKSNSSVKVEIPVEKVTPGTVAVIVKADGTEKIVSTSLVTENGVTLKLDGSATVKLVDNSKSFKDVPETNVFYNEVSSLSAREIMIGKTEDKFDLHNSVTLDQIANVAGRITGAVDVKDFNAGVAWGKDGGLKTGNVSATRGDVLKALYIAAGSPTVEDTGILAKFKDGANIPADMTAIAAWAAQNGILKGNVDGTAGLGNNVTRGQACALAGRTMGTLA